MAHKHGSGKAVGVAVALLLLAGAATLVAFAVRRSTPEKAVRRYLEASRTNDLAAMTAGLSQESRDKLEAYGGFMLPFDLVPPVDSSRGPAYTLGRISTAGRWARVPVTVQTPDLMAQTFDLPATDYTLVAVNDEGEWKVDLLATWLELKRAAAPLTGGTAAAPGWGR